MVKKHFQDFMKRLRKHYAPRPLRFYHCGEYGPKLGRPHYHALIFGLWFEDSVLWKETRGNRVYTSETLKKLWGMGFTSVGSVTFQSAAYVARYIMKKQTDQYADHAYSKVDPDTGELFRVIPEYTTMSLKPGIGASWFKEFSSDVFPADFVVHNGSKHKTPRFYDSLYENQAGTPALEAVKRSRVRAAKKYAANQTPERLAVRETVLDSKLNLLEREINDPENLRSFRRES